MRLGFSRRFPGGFREVIEGNQAKGTAAGKTRSQRLEQWSPAFLSPGTSFTGDNFSTDWGWGIWFQDDSSTLTVRFISITTSAPPQSIRHRPQRLETPRLEDPWAGGAGLGGTESSQDRQKGKDEQIQRRKVFVCYPNKLEQLKTPNNEIQL